MSTLYDMYTTNLELIVLRPANKTINIIFVILTHSFLFLRYLQIATIRSNNAFARKWQIWFIKYTSVFCLWWFCQKKAIQGILKDKDIRIRIKLYFILVLKTINISFKLSVTNGNKKTYNNKIHKVR